MILIAGETGSGKNNLLQILLTELAEGREHWITAVFPHKPSGLAFVGELYAVFGEAVFDFLLVDDLDGPEDGGEDRVIMARFVHASSARDPWQRQQDNDEARDNCLEMLAARRGITDLSQSPNLEQYGGLIVRVGQYQDAWYPASDLGKCMLVGTKYWRYFADHCTDPETREELLQLAEQFKNPRDQLNSVLAAKRMWEGIYRSAVIRKRCSKPPRFDKAEFLGTRKGIRVFLGGSRAPDALRTAVNTDLLETANLARAGRIGPGQYWIDELINYKFAQNTLAQLLATLRYTEMEIGLVIQSFTFATPEIKQSVVQNTGVKYLGRSDDPETADFIAQILRGSFDPYKEHHRERTVRQLHDGFDEVARKGETVTRDDKGVKTGQSEQLGKQLVARYREQVDERVHYLTGKEQEFWRAADVQEMPVGTFWVKRKGVRPFEWPVPLAPDSWACPGLALEKALECIARLKTLPVYDSPGPGRLEVPDLPPKPPKPPRAPRPKGNTRPRRTAGEMMRGNGTNGSGGSSKSTR